MRRATQSQVDVLKREMDAWTTVRVGALADYVEVGSDEVLRVLKLNGVPLVRRSGEWWAYGKPSRHANGRVLAEKGDAR